jgi:hypothetical protein
MGGEWLSLAEEVMPNHAKEPNCRQGQHEPCRAVVGTVLCIKARIYNVFARSHHDVNAGIA